MGWTKRTSKSKVEPDFMTAMLPPGFAADLKAGTPKSEMLAKLHDFILESENFTAAEAGRTPDLTPPTAEYLEHTYELYAALANKTGIA